MDFHHIPNTPPILRESCQGWSYWTLRLGSVHKGDMMKWSRISYTRAIAIMHTVCICLQNIWINLFITENKTHNFSTGYTDWKKVCLFLNIFTISARGLLL